MAGQDGGKSEGTNPLGVGQEQVPRIEPWKMERTITCATLLTHTQMAQPEKEADERWGVHLVSQVFGLCRLDLG